MEWQEKYSKNKIHFFGEEPKWIRQLSWDCDKKILIELGAGGGINTYYLKRKYPECKIFSIDISHLRCIRCRDNANSLVIQGDCCKLPFQKCSVDFVVCTMVIEHVPDDMTLIKEIERIAKPGGKVFLSSVIRMKFGVYFYRNINGQLMLDPTHVREYSSVAEFEVLFSDLFHIEQSKTSRICFSPLRFIFRTLFSLNIINSPNSKVFQSNHFLKLLSRIKFCIPRYRKIEVEAIKIDD